MAGQNADSNIAEDNSKDKVNESENPPPEEEWLKTSSDEEGENENMSINN
jgi:hypothetical protein